MSQLSLLDVRLQAELAQAPQWREPPSKIRPARDKPAADYGAWLDHADACGCCAEVQAELQRLRDRYGGYGGWEPEMPCPVGLRLLPTADIDLACPELDRYQGRKMLARLLDRALELRGGP